MRPSRMTHFVAGSRPRCVFVAISLGIVAIGCGDTVDPAGPDSTSLSLQNPQIAFVSNRDGAEAIYLASEDGSVVRRLTNGWRPIWSPDGSKILFYRFSPGSAARTYVINVDGTGDRLITDMSVLASWSPDGSKIVYSSPVGMPNGGIFVVNADGTNKTMLLSDDWEDPGGGDHLQWPAWSPDGTRISFVRANYDKSWQTFVMNSDGTAVRLLTNSNADQDPSWSPDGRMLAFGAFQSIGTINADGTGYRTYAPSFAFDPDWSPDGSKLIYNSFASPIGDEVSRFGSRMRIYVLDRQTGATTKLIPEATSPVKVNYWDHQAAWRRPVKSPAVH